MVVRYLPRFAFDTWLSAAWGSALRLAATATIISPGQLCETRVLCIDLCLLSS